ncbi:MAG: twin-arginine translocation signal domain-containing protein [Bacteroidota bacterium]
MNSPRRSFLRRLAAAGAGALVAPSLAFSEPASVYQPDHLASLAGETFRASAGAFRLVETERTTQPRVESCTLVFSGPDGLSDGIQRLRHPEVGRIDLFLKAQASGTRYEATVTQLV